MFAKIMVVVNFILAVAFLAAAGTLLGAAEDYKGKYEAYKKQAEADLKAKEDQVAAADNTAKANQDKFVGADKGRAAAEAQLKVLSESNQNLAAAFAQLKSSYDKLADAQKDMQGRLTSLNGDLDKVRGDLATSEAGRKEADGKGKALADELAREVQNKETAEKGLAAASAEQKVLQEQLDAAKTTLAQYMQEKGPLSGGLVMQDVHGVVQAVDNKNDIYVISVGSKDKVEVGYEFTVYRGSEYVSTIVIDRVFPNYASGMTKAGHKKRDVQAGDECATRL
jgi:septal ring factor EnvC (AmiA/AmiB activator)